MLQIWGIGIMGLNLLGVGVTLLQLVMVGLLVLGGPGGRTSSVLPMMLAGTLVPVLIYALFIRLGWGLFRGRRMAVIGVAILGGLGLLLAGGMTVAGLVSSRGGETAIVGLVLLCIVGVVYVPPVVVGVMRWNQLS